MTPQAPQQAPRAESPSARQPSAAPGGEPAAPPLHEEVAAGVEAYGLVRNMYADGKKEITKAGLIKVLYSF
ncbi:hypothetical protein COCSUDRAFT_56520 [Coccomyxa subellipsoidea C-169]|uniref:Uncharacterized protein n=1 Tax=Coccomyxa subellipsoidea (strain C-169) TaxID=574566 RepID=I0YUM0_COCSC|nr:hypothetical protein COCSUDRAFT_56520 [Coccomyxa subellipsoidea C-169]EIE22089.1 hypothetical protein COCSUDRAFT_56520 [Coccomyxa subellipsoidea C-169]|eukprot:XP_005646633.1 hypothetical protein COCSUDRAFT_56520 [Coccomyxa subellipsoidea C-169]